MTRYTITAAYNPFDLGTMDVTNHVVDAATRLDVACTIVHGTGYHPTWGREPVVVVTVVSGLGGDHTTQVFALSRDLCDAFDQDCVLVEAVGPAHYTAWLQSRPDPLTED